MAPSAEQRISIIIVGGGIGGLAFAIAAHLDGHSVRVFERRAEATSTGEMISIAGSAMRTPRKWPGFKELLEKAATDAPGFFRKWDGTTIAPVSLGGSSGDSTLIARGRLHTLLGDYAAAQGVPVEYNAGGQEFFETGSQGGIILSDGRKFTADLVLASDGIGSKSWTLFAGTNTTPVSSGFVVYRYTFPTAEALKSPLVVKEFGEYKGHGFFYAGPDAHFVVCMDGDSIGWMLTCRDHNSDAEESWSKVTTIDNALEVVKDWDPFIPALLKTVPDRTCFDWKMMWRDPQPQWTSTGGRVVQLGDAAHPFLPTSGSGATMALEDAWSLAACLKIGGKENLPLAVRVHNKLRFERVSCAQKLGFKNREVLHKTDWDYVSQHPEVLGEIFYKSWIHNHNPEEYAIENYDKAAEHILKGTPFTNTNHVPGFTYKHWTVNELLEASANGVPVVDEGNWL